MKGLKIVLISFIFFLSIGYEAMTQESLKSLPGLKTIVIDPGHGGKDPGCISPDKKTYEKTITLSVSKKIHKKLQKLYPDMNIILTRDKDVYLTLDERAEVANKNSANLFVSVHVNSSSSRSVSGYSIHILGQSRDKNRDLFSNNMDVCKRENSVILLDEDHSAKYKDFDPDDPESFIFMHLMQNAHLEQSFIFAQHLNKTMAEVGPIKESKGIWQDPFYVLWRTAMPAVLLEIGFMTNSGDLSIMRSEKEQDKIAEGVLKAINKFKKEYDSSVRLEFDNNANSKTGNATGDSKNNTTTNTNAKTSTGTKQVKKENKAQHPDKKEPPKAKPDNSHKKTREEIEAEKFRNEEKMKRREILKRIRLEEKQREERERQERQREEEQNYQEQEDNYTEDLEQYAKSTSLSEEQEESDTYDDKNADDFLPEESADDDTIYGLQIGAFRNRLKSNDPFFRGYEVIVIKERGFYKYIIEVPSLSSAKHTKQISKLFKDSFPVEVKDGKIKRLYFDPID